MSALPSAPAPTPREGSGLQEAGQGSEHRYPLRGDALGSGASGRRGEGVGAETRGVGPKGEGVGASERGIGATGGSEASGHEGSGLRAGRRTSPCRARFTFIYEGERAVGSGEGSQQRQARGRRTAPGAPLSAQIQIAGRRGRAHALLRDDGLL